MNIFAFYIAGSALSGALALYIFKSYLKTKERILGFLSLAFILVSAHAFILSLPLFIKPENPFTWQTLYIVATGILFLILLAGIEVQIFLTKAIFTKRSLHTISFIITTLCLLTLAIQTKDLMSGSEQTLQTLKSAVPTFWVSNTIAEYIISITSALYGIIWLTIFYKSAFIVENMLARIKMLIIGVYGFILGLVVVLIHISSNQTAITAGLTLFVFSSAVSAGAYALPKSFYKTEGS